MVTMLLAGSAVAETVTLAEMKTQAPQRLQMTVTTDEGETITVDAPVYLPDADEMPILLAKRMTMDTSTLREKYPLEKGTSASYRKADGAHNFDGSSVISYDMGGWDTLLGKTDYSKRAVLAPGETPPENDLTLDDVLDIAYARIAEFGGDPSVDIRVYRANAMSGLYRIEMVKFENKEAGVSFRMPDVDLEKPIKNGSKGMWEVWLTQYFRNIPVFTTQYRPEYEPKGAWPYPNMGLMRVIDEEHMSMLFSCCVETGVVKAEAGLQPFAELERTIRERIQSGQLKSVYQVSLGYAFKLVKGDSFKTFVSGEPSRFNTDARFVLVPTWQICGYDLKNRKSRYFQGYTEPSELEVMQNLDGHYDLWIDATTAQAMIDPEYDMP